MTEKASKPIDIGKAFTDKTLEKEGVWVHLPDFGFSVRVARMNNPNYQREFAKRMKPFRQYIDSSGRLNIPDEATAIEVADVTHKLYADEILLAIQDGLAFNGEPFPSTTENKLKLLEDADFFKQVNEAASTMETFRRIEAEQDAKNSEASSNGSSSTQKKKAKA